MQNRIMLATKTSFRDSVYDFARTIPVGKVVTYGQVAQAAGNPRAARAVGMLMRNNPDNTSVPCHRVVGAGGALTGYAFGNGLSTKKAMLTKEGVLFKGDKVDLASSQWDPR